MIALFCGSKKHQFPAGVKWLFNVAVFFIVTVDGPELQTAMWHNCGFAIYVLFSTFSAKYLTKDYKLLIITTSTIICMIVEGPLHVQTGIHDEDA